MPHLAQVGHLAYPAEAWYPGIMATYSIGKHITLNIDWCAFRGHVWLLDKNDNRWCCDRCPARLYVSQMDSYRNIPIPFQTVTHETYGRYQFSTVPAREVVTA